MKKIILIFLAGIILFSVCSCNMNDNPADNVTVKEKTVKDTEKTTVKEERSSEIFSPKKASNWKYADALEIPGIASSDDWKLLLVNRDFILEENYIDSIKLVNVCGTGERLDERVAKEYEKMFDAAATENIFLTPCSGYRSIETQRNNFENRIDRYISEGQSKPDAIVSASKVILPPGTSEHNAGLAMDIVCVEEWFETTEAFRWLTENAQDYGFILRYPKDKQDITKIIYEPWHWRYVGVEAAMAMKKSGQCLEEYLNMD